VKEELIETYKDLYFDEETHYYSVRGKEKKSVSKTYSRFIVPFDNKISHFVAIAHNKRNPKNPITKQQVLNEWSIKRERSIVLGNQVHLFAQKWIENRDIVPTCCQEEGVIEFFESLDPKYELIIQEFGIYSDKYHIAGTLDILLFNHETGDLIIADIKTNEDLFKNYKKKTLKEPFKDLLDSPFNKYQLQQNYYKILLEERSGLKVEDLWIIWLSPDHKGEGGINYCQYSCQDLTQRIKDYHDRTNS